MLKKLLSTVLALCLIATMIPFSVVAAEGTEYRIYGEVKKNGWLFKGATIKLYDSADNEIDSTSLNGNYEFFVEPGTYKIKVYEAYKGGEASASSDTVEVSTEDKQVNINFSVPTYNFNGYIKNAEGEGISTVATIYYLDQSFFAQVYTDSNTGYFGFGTNPEGEYIFKVAKDGYETVEERIILTTNIVGNVYTLRVASSSGGGSTGGSGGSSEDSGKNSSPTQNTANTPETLDALNQLGEGRELPSGAVNQNGRTVLPVNLSSGTSALGLELMNTLGGLPSNVGLQASLDGGAATLTLPGGFGNVNEPGRIYYPLDFVTPAPDEAEILKSGSNPQQYMTFKLGANFTLPASGTVSVKTKLPEGETAYVYRYDSTGKLVLVATSKVQDGRVQFDTAQLGQFIITTSKI